VLAIRDAVAEIVDDLSAHEDNSDPRGTVDIDVKDQPPLAQISTAEDRLAVEGGNCRNGGGPRSRFCAFRAWGYSMKLLRL
jgi:hypothetical protein